MIDLSDVMQKAANDPLACRQRVVVLYEADVDAVLSQHVLLDDLGKEPPRIDVTYWFEDPDVGNLGFDNLHGNC